MRNIIAIVIMISGCLMANAVFAKPDHAKGPHKAPSHSTKLHTDSHKSDKVLVSLDAPHVHSIAERLKPYYTRKCPPGLAKKHNGCLPPGHARGYVIGAPLPGSYWPVPDDVLVMLPRAPIGGKYVWVDRDILLISEATKKVLDAVVILSGVN